VCAILGWAGRGRRSWDQEAFARALGLLAHRGPDDAGIWSADEVVLGNRRLAIIDLTASGHQPMASRSARSVITFNGEIYNHPELRLELQSAGHAVQGASDTAVLVEALEAWGPTAFSRLNGMWAFGLWHVERRQLLLGRDRFGVKPLYYRRVPGGIAFASEPKAILALYPECRRIDDATMLEFLSYNYLYVRERSFYSDVRVLPPAHFAVYDVATDAFTLHRYWDYPEVAERRFSPGEAVEEFQRLFEDAVRVRLRSDVPLGVTLSGGLDSSAVLSAAAKSTSEPLTCYTSTYAQSEVSELSWAQAAARAARAHVREVPAPQAEWLGVLREVVWHMDAPGYSPAVYPLWRVMQTARSEGVPVLLQGQGADEALGGYPQYSILELLDFLGSPGALRSPAQLLLRLRRICRTFPLRWALAWLAREVWPWTVGVHRRREGFQSLLRSGVTLPQAEAAAEDGHDRVRARLRTDHACLILPGLLHYCDAVSMAHAIEVRDPFLDYRLVEWLFRLPTEFKLRDGETKWVLREYLRRNFMRAIGDRTDKQGYPTPVGAWLASEEGRALESRLSHADSPLQQWIDPRRVSRLFQAHRIGALSTEHHLYKLVATPTWIDRCIAPAAA
jgi:asparagine synthase (glutamine-hydrolysing)